MQSPNKNSSFNKYSFIRETSSYSSYIQTESSTRISRSELKKINRLKKSMNAYINISRNYRNNINNLYNKKILNLTSNTVLYPYIQNNNEYNFNEKRMKNLKNNVVKYKIRARSENNSLNNKINNNYFTYDKGMIMYKDRLRRKDPFYRYYTSRNKSFIDFNNDTRNLRYLKINSYNGKKAIDQLNENILYNNQASELEEITKQKMSPLMKIYGESFYYYLSYLNSKLKEESIINYNLLNKKKLLINDILKMEKQINKIISKYEEYLDNKYFLICIKECSNDYKKFPKETQIDILNDLYNYYIYKKLIYDESLNYNTINKQEDNNEDFYNFYFFINNICQKLKNNFDSNKKIMFLNYIIISIDLNNFFDIVNNINCNYIISHKKKNIFHTIGEFENKLNNFFSLNIISLSNFNILNSAIYNLINEMKEVRENKKKESKIIDKIKDKINILKGKLNIIKTNYLNNLHEYNNYKKNKKEIDKNIIVINNKINTMANNIKKCNLLNFTSFKIIKSYKEENQPITIIEKMNYCERVFNYLLKYKNEQTLNNLANYNKVIKNIKTEQIKNKLRNREETMRKIINLKTKKILEKNNKIQFINYRKIDKKRIQKK